MCLAHFDVQKGFIYLENGRIDGHFRLIGENNRRNLSCAQGKSMFAEDNHHYHHNTIDADNCPQGYTWSIIHDDCLGQIIMYLE